jgi:hypothetical protein
MEILSMMPTNVEVSIKERKVHSFLEDLIELCVKHQAYITTYEEKTNVEFQGWEGFTELEVDSESASLHWPRIQTELVTRRKNEQWKSKENS